MRLYLWVLVNVCLFLCGAHVVVMYVGVGVCAWVLMHAHVVVDVWVNTCVGNFACMAILISECCMNITGNNRCVLHIDY